MGIFGRRPTTLELLEMSAQKPSASTSKGLNTSRDAGKIVGLTKLVRTAVVRLKVSTEDSLKLHETQNLFGKACNVLVSILRKGDRNERLWQRFNLHRAGYASVRLAVPEIGSQLVCNAVRAVSSAAKSWISNNPKFVTDKTMELPEFDFSHPVVHLDKNTVSFSKDKTVASIYTLRGRIKAELCPGDFQKQILASGKWKESNLVFHKERRHGRPDYWALHITVEEPTLKINLDDLKPEEVEGVDVGENNPAANTSHIWKGGKLKNKRDRYLSNRTRLQRNGSRSAKQHLRKASRRERRHVKHVNNVISKQIVEEARKKGVRVICLEDLTHIRDRIKAGKRVRTRLHRWSFHELQEMIIVKAARAGIETIKVDPRFTSQTCNACKQIAKRRKHTLVCQCGNRAHSDVNSARNLRDLGYLLIAQELK